jgi:hypothetical protein
MQHFTIIFRRYFKLLHVQNHQKEELKQINHIQSKLLIDKLVLRKTL